MNIFIVTTNYFDNGVFGTYSSVKRARMAIEHYFHEEPSIVSFKDSGDYTYEIYTRNGDMFYAEIVSDSLDYEFVRGELKEDE